MTSQPLLTGQWDDNQSWQLYRSDELPDITLCTAVYCLAILPAAKQIVLARNHRGWDMLGGHIEPGEMVEQALLRECLEEGGFTPEYYRLFGYRKITAKRLVPHNQRADGFYPFPHGFIPHFIATSDLPLQRPHGPEIVESRAFSFNEVVGLHIKQWPILRGMLDFYCKTKNFTQSPSAKISL